MKRSLRLRQFLIIMMVTIFVVLSSRWYAQQRASVEFRKDLHHYIELSLMGCTDVADNPDARLVCHTRKFKNYIFNRLSGEVTLCHNAQIVGELGDSSNCVLLDQAPEFWSGTDVSSEPAVQLVVNTLGGQLWHIARFKAHPETQIMTSEEELNRSLEALFKIRDKQLPIFIPILTLSALLLALYVTNLTLYPLEKIKLALSNLTNENINKVERLSTPFQEFDGFIDVYHQLLQRLDESFTKAKRFSSDAAHELRTPLTILRGKAENLIANAPTGSTLQVQLRSMADEIERLIEISEKLLLLSQADAKQIGYDLIDVDISEVMDELADNLASDNPKLSIEKDIQGGVHWYCDPSLMQQLIHNLSSNAVKYNTPNGRIKLTLRRNAEMLDLSVENTSSDIPGDLSEKAFDRFYRGDSARNRQVDGSGLGLSICKEISTLHKGTLTLEVTQAQTVIARFHGPSMLTFIA